MRSILTRRDVEAIHACVSACNPREMIGGRDVRGPHDDLVEKLRDLWWTIGREGMPLVRKPEPGAPDTVVVDPTISAEAGDGGHAAQGDPASALSHVAPETAPSPAAADSRCTQRGEKPSPCGSDVGGCSFDDTASYRLGSTSSARPGGERCGPATSNVGAHAPAKDDASDGGDPGLRPGAVSPPAAADSPITVAGGRVALRTETIDAIFSGGAGMPDPEEQLNKRRRARTRAV